MPQTFKNEEKAFRKIESNISIKCINRRSKKSYLWRSHRCCFYGLDVRRKMEGDFGQSGLALLAGTNISYKSIKEISLISYLIYSLLLICNHVVTNRKVLDIPWETNGTFLPCWSIWTMFFSIFPIAVTVRMVFFNFSSCDWTVFSP